MNLVNSPKGAVALFRQIAASALLPVEVVFSGEITTSLVDKPATSPRVGGKVKDFYLSVKHCGTDITNTLAVSGECYINGTTCLTTQPIIGAVSGEDSSAKTTKVTGDTAIQQAVVDTTANIFTPGDIISVTAFLQRTASPVTEMSNLIAVIELEPGEAT